MSAPTYEEVQSAIQRFVVLATGIAADRVRWSDQGGKIPASPGPWVSLNILTEGPTGHPWIDVEDAESPAPGAEIDHIARSQNAGTLSIQVFGADAAGNGSALAILRKIRPARMFPSAREILDGVVGFGAFEPARSVPTLTNSTFFEPRGILSCRIHTAAELRATAAGPELGTYIETVEIDGTAAEVGEEP